MCLIGVFYLCTQHVLIKHGPWFVEEYGSLSIWSCQGMEKSHHAAKAATQAHTQHGGTGNRTSIIIQHMSGGIDAFSTAMHEKSS